MARYDASKRSGLYNWSKRQQANAVGRWMERNLHGIGHPGMVLEIGPGAGEMAHVLRRWGQYRTQDVLDNADYHEALPCVPACPYVGGWSMIYASHVLEHMPDTDTALRAFLWIHHALRPGGALVMQVPDLMRWGLEFWDVDATHSVPFTRRRIRHFAQHAGLRIERITLVTGPVVGLAAYCVSTLWRFGFAKFLLGFFPELAARVRQAGYTLNGDILAVLRRDA